MEPLKAFLDANVLFSAAMGGPTFEFLWSLSDSGHLTLVTSRTCVTEAERNLLRKRRAAWHAYEGRMRSVQVVPDVMQGLESVALPAKDAPIYATAVAIRADVFLTGDLRHFGELMAKPDAPIRVQTPRAFLLER